MSTLEFDDKILSSQNLTDLLSIRDLCILMTQSRGIFRERMEDNLYSGYDYNSLTLEIGFLQDVKVAISKNILFRLKTNTNLTPFEDINSRNRIIELDLESYFSPNFFNKDEIRINQFEVIKIAKVLFPNFHKSISEDWKFL